ncbi:MAG: L-serine ammonia-lyase, iron-sulfur-dependent subunit beta [Candidatus Peregrinibacteria bacterium]
MKTQHLSIFDIAGPVMVGPSSSHTAGACKIGQFARALFHGTPTKITFYLHGSFGEVYKGHATDRALLAGTMKFHTSEPHIKDSFKIAEEKGIKYEFHKKNLGEKYHPNTVKIVLENSKRKMSVIGSSIGGGMIEILKIDNFKVYIKGRAGKYHSIVVYHDKKRTIVPKIIQKLKRINIKVPQIQQTDYGKKTLSVLNLEGKDGKTVTLQDVVEMEKSMEGVDFIRSLSKLQRQ